MKENELCELLNTDFPDIGKINKEVVVFTQENASKFRGSMRISTGRIVTEEDIQKMEKIRNLPLP
jgi:hypothetical protein